MVAPERNSVRVTVCLSANDTPSAGAIGVGELALEGGSLLLEPRNHLGIEVDSIEEINSWKHHLQKEGILEKVEEDQICCFARQDKLWFTDPDGNAIADWTRGTTLIPYLERLPTELHDPFMARYREKLRRTWPTGPVLFTFRRIILSASRPG